jgi:hypothetical protein
MPDTALWCDLHRVDVWELLPPPRVAQFFHGEDFSEIFNERPGCGCVGSSEMGWKNSSGLSG